MPEIPEHLLQRSKERRKALGLPVPGEEGEAEAPGRRPRGRSSRRDSRRRGPRRGGRRTRRGRRDRQRRQDPGPPARAVEAPPCHRCRRGRRHARGGRRGRGCHRHGHAPGAHGHRPRGHTQRLLTVVKSGSIQQTRAEAQDKVHTWPHLLVVEFAALLIVTAALTIFSAMVRAPLLGLADFNKTPNPSKAPWYFLGLQELLTMFHPMIAGVTIPGMGLFLLMVAPFVDKNPSNKPKDRKFAISIFTIFVMLWAVLVIIGSFFRGPGFNFTFPWKDGVFFDL